MGLATACARCWRPTLRIPLGLMALSLCVALLVLAPMAWTVAQAASFGLRQGGQLLFRPLVGELAENTLLIVCSATLICAVLGTSAAWFVERTRLPGRRFWALFAAVPLAVPPFISSYAWVSFSPALQDFGGALLVVCCAYYPLIYLPVAAALRGMDPGLEEAARSLGLAPWACFRRVVLPQLRPALFGGMLLVALSVLTEFGAFALLRFRTFTTEIYAEYRAGFDGSGAALLACVLMLLCVFCVLLEFRVRGRARYDRLDRGARRAAMRYALGWSKWPVLGGFTLLALATLGVPLGMTAYWLFQQGDAATAPVMVSASQLLAACGASLELGLSGAALTTAMAFPLGLLLIRHPGRLSRIFERVAYLGQGVPGIVIALAVISLAIRAIQPLYQSTLLLLLTYAVLFLPLALVGVRSALVQVERRLEHAARSLGLNSWQTLWRVTLPLVAPGIGAAAAMVFLSVTTELTATLLLAPIGTQTLATEVWADTSTLAFADAAPFAAILIAISLFATWLLMSLYGKSAIPGAVLAGHDHG